jgi:hypothetical protein
MIERYRSAEEIRDVEWKEGTYLRDSVRVSEDDTDLRGRETLLGELEDVLADLLGSRLEPSRRRSLVGKRRGGDTLSRCVHSKIDQNRRFKGRGSA